MNLWTFLDRNADILPALAFIIGLALVGSCGVAASTYEHTHSCAPATGGK